MAVPEATPPGIYERSALLTPYAAVSDFTPTPEAKEAVLIPGWQPRTNCSALKILSGLNTPGNPVTRK